MSARHSNQNVLSSPSPRCLHVARLKSASHECTAVVSLLLKLKICKYYKLIIND